MIAPENTLSSIERVHVPLSIADGTVRFFRECGELHCEGLVLWLGEIASERAQIEELFIPPQHSIQSEHGVGYFVDGDSLFELNRYLSLHKLRLIAQVHSHPGRAYHSETDDEYAIVTTEGGFSLVVPDFGNGQVTFSRWAVYRLQEGTWMEVDPEKASSLFVFREEDT